MTKTNINIADIIGGGYGKFWRDKHRYRVLKGGKGSKKSSTTSLWYIYHLMKYPDSNLLVVRAVMDTHRDSTFAQLKWAQETLKVSHLWRNTVSPMSMTYKPTGQKIIFKGFDDALKLASTTVSKGYLCWVWIEEAFEIATEDDFDYLDLSLPRSEVPPPLFNQTTITFNPWSETHWLKRRFFDTPSELVSTYSTDYRCNEHLSKDYLLCMEEMKKNNPRKYAVAGLGEWGIAEGLVYENWEELDFEINELGIERDENGRIISDESWQYRSFFGLDYGYMNDPTAFIAFKANPLTKQLFIYDEHYELNMLNSDIALMIKRKGYAKERIRADAAEPKSNEDLRRQGIYRIEPSRKGKDSVINGIAAVSEYKIFIHPSCVNTLTEIQNYCFKRDKDERGINQPEDKNNHLMDAMRYAFYDVMFFHPEDPRARRKRSYEERYDITAEDMEGGWNV
nr:MAG TPA: terminase large subunit [Caudoviricetes sp.]